MSDRVSLDREPERRVGAGLPLREEVGAFPDHRLLELVAVLIADEVEGVADTDPGPRGVVPRLPDASLIDDSHISIGS